jgi:hypothetical protein
MHFMRGRQLSAALAVCSQLQLVTNVFRLCSNVYFCMTPTRNTDLLESVGENFDVNFVMKELPEEKINAQFG